MSIAEAGGKITWDDLQVNVGRVRFPGVADPTWAAYDHGTGDGIDYDVLGFAVGDRVDFDVQTSHAMKLNSLLDIHIHFILPNTTTIGNKFKFQIDVIGAGINAVFDTSTNSPFTAEHTVAANDNTHHRLLDIGDIDAMNTTVSSIYTCKLTRIAASAGEYGSVVYVKYIDGHYQRDTDGSRFEGIK